MVVGVDDRAAERSTALTGVPPDLNAETLRRAVYDRTRPAITPFVSELLVDGVRVLVMTVKPETGRIAVKVINAYGDEVMKVFNV